MRSYCAILVSLQYAPIDGLIENIHICRREPASADFALEQQVQFGKCPTTRLRYAEVRVDDAKKRKASPEETGIWSRILVLNHVFGIGDVRRCTYSCPSSKP